MKRNVLASFTNVLLLPVTIVPRAVGSFVTTSSTVAVNGIAMLNPQRWGAQASSTGYSTDFSKGDSDLLYDDGEVEEKGRPSNVFISLSSLKY